jgi:ABC-2 type transport system ATP-binding protein
MMASAIETNDLTKRFGSLTAVNGINLRINEGEIFGLLGPNGAGKTTTLSMLATLVHPTSGEAYVNGHSIKKEQGAVRKSIGFVFQDPSSDDTLTGRENLYLHALLYSVNLTNINAKIDGVLELVDLKDKQRVLVKYYSGGMRRRLELARGLLHEPRILFLDEPTLGLDPQTREHMWEYIKKLSSEKKVTIIVTTHYMEEAEQLCDRVAIIDHGVVKVLDTPANLRKKLGGDLVTLKFHNKPDLKRLKRLKFIKKMETKGTTVRLTVYNSAAHLQSILKSVGKVEAVESRSPTLNDVFLHYTGKEIREGGEEAEGGTMDRIMHYRENSHR